MYTGHIYDTFGNPIPNAKVSDGLNIAITDENGAYTLNGWERAHVISVQILTVYHDDWYRYIDESVHEYDFYVSPYINNNEVSFLHFSDTEILIDGAHPSMWIDFVKGAVEKRSPDFIIHTGDICRRKGLELHKRAMCSENMGLPVRYTLGNHDYVDDKYGEYTFERLYGPLWYSFDVGCVHFVVIPITNGETKGVYLPEDNVRWLKNDLSMMDESKRLVILSHDHNDSFENECVYKRGEIAVELKNHRILANVFGHSHLNYLREIDGRYNIGTSRPDLGGIDGTPASCRYVKIDKDGNLFSILDYDEETGEKNAFGRTALDGNICFTSPLYAENAIFVPTFNDGYPKENYVYKLSMDRTILGRCKIEGSVKWNMAYGNGILYAVDDTGKIYFINAENCEILKTAKLPNQRLPAYSGGVTLSGELLYAATTEKICVYDAKSGELISAINDGIDSGASSVSAPIIYDGKIIRGKHWRGLICTDAKSGEVLWYNKDVKDCVENPIRVGDDIIAPTRFFVSKIDKNGNTIAKSTERGQNSYNVTAEPIYHNGHLYVPTSDCGIEVLDYETLEHLHSFDCGKSLLGAVSYLPKWTKATFGKPILKDDTLIFSAADGCVYFYDVITYELKKCVKIGHPILSGAVETDKGLCVADFDGGVSFIN